jgi:uncharacterized protein (TIGR02147 family)
MKTNRPNIYEYNNFRKFIADFQDAAYRQDRSYTKSHMVKLLGLPNSRSFLSDVLRGKRISDAFIERFIKLFGFNSDEANFFRTLVRFNQCENVDERELCFEQLISLNRTPKKLLYKKSFEYYKDWYNGALRALLNIYDFDGTDFHVLGKKLVPAVSAPKIRQAFNLLVRMGMVAKDTNGFFKPTANAISTEDYLRDEVLRQFQIKCLELAKSAIVNDAGSPKVIAVNTLSVSKTGLKRIEKQIEHFRSQVRSIVHKDEEKPESVYQMDVLFFPMSK